VCVCVVSCNVMLRMPNVMYICLMQLPFKHHCSADHHERINPVSEG